MSNDGFERLKTLLDYNPVSGQLTRRGKVAGRKPSARPGFRMLVSGKLYHRSHLIWLLANGEWPKRVYFADGNNQNYSLSNLTLLKPRRKKKQS